VPATPAAQQAPGELPPAAAIGATGTFLTEEAKLTAALPKLKAAADAFPDSNAGIQARYHMASTLAYLGRRQEAIDAFADVERRAGPSSLYGRMARLGKAEAQAQAGQIDAAIATWKDLSADTNSDLPQDAILIELARAYAVKGNRQEAEKTFNQLVEQHPDSPYAGEAKQELENLKS
jgi:tetratricopeptide (TPR) repeat protein